MTTPVCPRCQTELRDADNFCPKCGMARPRTIPGSDADLARAIVQAWDDECSLWVKPFSEWDESNQREALRMLTKARELLCGPKDAKIAKLTADLKEEHAKLRKVCHALGICHCADYVCEPGELEAVLKRVDELNGYEAEAFDYEEAFKALREHVGLTEDASLGDVVDKFKADLASARRPQSSSRARMETLEQVIGVIDRVKSGCMGRTADKLAEVRVFCAAERDACPDSAPAVDLEAMSAEARREAFQDAIMWVDNCRSPWNSNEVRAQAYTKVIDWLVEKRDACQPDAGPQPPKCDRCGETKAACDLATAEGNPCLQPPAVDVEGLAKVMRRAWFPGCIRWRNAQEQDKEKWRYAARAALDYITGAKP